MQDLVYKRGQAGINKATVTIVFNNEDKSQSPVGYKECKQIIICRQVGIFSCGMTWHAYFLYTFRLFLVAKTST